MSKVFTSYSHKDVKWKDAPQVHLEPLAEEIELDY
jgi:hypothetical protein